MTRYKTIATISKTLLSTIVGQLTYGLGQNTANMVRGAKIVSGPVTAVCTYKTLVKLYVLGTIVHFHHPSAFRIALWTPFLVRNRLATTRLSQFCTYSLIKMTDGTIARKPKRSPLAKQFRKWNNYFAGMALPFAR